MTKEEICKNCKYYIPGRGKYRSGLCVSDKSHKRNKDFTLSKDHCKYWERSTDE